MFRNKVILTFAVVWCAVCVSYVGVRAAMGAVLDGLSMTGENAEEVQEVDVQTEEPPQVTPLSKTEPVASSVIEVKTEPVTSMEVPTSESEADEAKTPDVPSLSEYLSGFTCGSCRHNCTLDNPRCFNGSRLAEAKAQEYQELYQ